MKIQFQLVRLAWLPYCNKMPVESSGCWKCVRFEWVSGNKVEGNIVLIKLEIEM